MNISINQSGWAVTNLEDITTRITKGGTPTTYGYSFQKEGINFIKVENISCGRVNLKSITDYINKEAHEFQSKSRLSVGDVLFSIAGTIGETCVIRQEYLPANTNQALAIIKGTDCAILPKLLEYQLGAFVAKVKIKARGGAMNNVSLEDLKKLQVYIPPLPEQHRIVAKIEELFSSLDKGIESLKTAQQQIKVYRQAVLKWAFEGKLTNKNVVDGELPEGWKWVKLVEIIQTLDQGWSPKCENASSHSNNEWAVIKTTAVQSGYFIETENKILPRNLEPRKQHELRVGDILITRAGPRVRVGICCMIKHVRPKLINCDKVYRIRVKDIEVIPNYFTLTLNSPDYSDEIEKMKTGISDSGVNLTQKGFLQISIKLPPIKEQQAIVAEIESRLSVCDKIEESIEQSLKQSEALRQSILKKAFEGKLVPQDPNDEPASILLDRIRRERSETTASQPKIRNRK